MLGPMGCIGRATSRLSTARQSVVLGILWLVAVPFRVAAQTPAMFDHLGPAKGLPSSHVEALVQDRYGYLWIGTRGGLVRHEGSRLRVLRHDPDQPGSLPGNNVLALLAAADGSLWAAISDQGLVRLDGTTVAEHFKPVSRGGVLEGNYIWSLSEACDGSIWALYARDGLVRIDPASGSTRHFGPGENGLPKAGFGLQLVRAPDCSLWMVRADSLWRIDPQAPHAFERVLDAADFDLDVLLALAFVDQERAYLGGRDAVVELLPDSSGVEVPAGRRWPTARPVSMLVPAEEGGLWIGLPDDFWLLDPDADSILRFSEDAGGDVGPLQVTDLLPGREGEIWIATSGGGVVRLPPGWRGLTAFRPSESRPGPLNVTAVSADPGGRVWIGGDSGGDSGGVQWLDPDRGERGPIEPIPVGRRDRTPEVIDLHADAESLWVLQRRFLVRRMHLDGRIVPVLERDLDTEERFAFIEPDQSGGLWLGIEGGELLRLDRAGGIVDRWHAHADPGRRLEDPAPRSMVRGPDGAWWFLGSRWLYRFDADGRPVPVHGGGDAVLQAMAFDEDRLWLASDSLLQRLRLDEDQLHPELRLTARHGLPHGRIQALVAQADRVWVLTSAGLARFDPERERFRQFSVAEGLRLAEFNPGAVATLADGRILAGSTAGLLQVEPDRIEIARRPPPVWLTGVRSGDREWHLRPDGPRQLDLDWHENSVRLSYLALSYLNPEGNRYRVRLRGWDRDWISLTGETERDYGRLPSGRYRFEVQAAGVDGVWNLRGDALELQIAAPPWRTPWAMLFYAGAALGLLALSWRAILQRRRRQAALQRARERQQIAAAASAAKSEFLAVMSHEIRTPLHGLLGMMALLEQRLDRPSGRDMLETMRRSGSQLKRIVDDALDLSSIEAGRIELRPVAVALPALLEQAVDLRAGEAWSRGLVLRLRIASDLPLIAVVDPDRLAQLLGNLLGNAIKFTARGAVELEARLDSAGRLVLAVTDTGPGIDPDRAKTLFVPFRRLETARPERAEGTGLGLAICKRLAAAMGGCIDLASRPGCGSRFTLRLPLSGMTPAPRLNSQLLEGVRVAAALPAPEMRVLQRLARRWQIDLRRIDRGAAADDVEVLLTAPGGLTTEALSAWVDAGAAGFWLAAEDAPPIGMTRLRPPLTEARLLGALFDLRLAAAARSGFSADRSA